MPFLECMDNDLGLWPLSYARRGIEHDRIGTQGTICIIAHSY